MDEKDEWPRQRSNAKGILKKLRKKVEKGECNTIGIYRECALLEPPIKGLPGLSMEESHSRSRKQAKWDFDSDELRGLLSTLLLGAPSLPAVFKMSNRHFARNVTVLHISNWENEEVEEDNLGESLYLPLTRILTEIDQEDKESLEQKICSPFSSLHGVRVSHSQDTVYPLPYRLLAVPVEKGTSAAKSKAKTGPAAGVAKTWAGSAGNGIKTGSADSNTKIDFAVDTSRDTVHKTGEDASLKVERRDHRMSISSVQNTEEEDMHRRREEVLAVQRIYAPYLIPYGVLQMWAYPWPVSESRSKGCLGGLLSRTQKKKNKKKKSDEEGNKVLKSKESKDHNRSIKMAIAENAEPAGPVGTATDCAKEVKEESKRTRGREPKEQEEAYKDPKLHYYGRYRGFAPSFATAEQISTRAAAATTGATCTTACSNVMDLDVCYEGKEDNGWSMTCSRRSSTYISLIWGERDMSTAISSISDISATVGGNSAGSSTNSADSETERLLAQIPFFPLVAIDCEMCVTGGNTEQDPDAKHTAELTRLTLVAPCEGTDTDECSPTVLVDVYVRPRDDAPITDYVTQYSGITEQIMTSHDTISFHQAQLLFLRLVSAETFLVGHSLDSDLKSLQVVHRNCLDTAILYPHPKGFPIRYKLRQLAQDHLKMSIQNHDQHNRDSRQKRHCKNQDGKSGSILGAYMRDVHIYLGERKSRGEKRENEENRATGGADEMAPRKMADGHDSVEDAVAALRLVQLKAKEGFAYGLPKKSDGGIHAVPLLAGARTGMTIMPSIETTETDTAENTTDIANTTEHAEGSGKHPPPAPSDRDSVVDLSNCIAIWEHTEGLIGPKRGGGNGGNGNNARSAAILFTPTQQCLVGEMKVRVCDQQSGHLPEEEEEDDDDEDEGKGRERGEGKEDGTSSMFSAQELATATAIEFLQASSPINSPARAGSDDTSPVGGTSGVPPIRFCFAQIDFKKDQKPHRIDDKTEEGPAPVLLPTQTVTLLPNDPRVFPTFPSLDLVFGTSNPAPPAPPATSAADTTTASVLGDKLDTAVTADEIDSACNPGRPSNAAAKKKKFGPLVPSSQQRMAAIKTAIKTVRAAMRQGSQGRAGGLLLVTAQPPLTAAKELKRQKHMAQYGSMTTLPWNIGREGVLKKEVAKANHACVAFSTFL